MDVATYIACFLLGWLAGREYRRWRARRFMAAGVKSAPLPLGKLTQEEWERLVDELAATRKTVGKPK